MNAPVKPELADWELAMDRLRESERRLNAAVSRQDVHAAWAAHEAVDRVALEVALLLASAVEATLALEHGHERG